MAVATVKLPTTQVDPTKGDGRGRRGRVDDRPQGGEGGDRPPPSGLVAVRRSQERSYLPGMEILVISFFTFLLFTESSRSGIYRLILVDNAN